MSFFAGIENSKVNNGGNYIRPGFYLLQLLKASVVPVRGGAPMFVADVLVLESRQNTQPDHNGKIYEPNPVGSTTSWCCPLDPAFLDTALGNIKGHIAAVFNVDDSKINQAASDRYISQAQPGVGRTVRAEAWNIRTKQKGADFTKVKWMAEPDAGERQKAFQAALAAGRSPVAEAQTRLGYVPPPSAPANAPTAGGPVPVPVQGAAANHVMNATPPPARPAFMGPASTPAPAPAVEEDLPF